MAKMERTGIIRDFDSKTVGTRVFLGFVYLLAAVIIFLSLFPFIWVLMTGFKTQAEYFSSTAFFPDSFALFGKDVYDVRYLDTWTQLEFGRPYLNSLLSVIGSVICALIFNGILAYGLSVLKPKGHKILLSAVMFALLIPPTTSFIPLFHSIDAIGMTGFFWPLWLAAGANAFYVVLFKSFFDSFPGAIVEASHIDGCTSLDTFFRIVLPLSKPICVVVTIYAINGAWSDFLMPYLVLNNSDWTTVMVRLFTLAGDATHADVEVLRAVVFAIIPPTILFFIFQKQLTQNLVTSGIKG